MISCEITISDMEKHILYCMAGMVASQSIEELEYYKRITEQNLASFYRQLAFDLEHFGFIRMD